MGFGTPDVGAYAKYSTYTPGALDPKLSRVAFEEREGGGGLLCELYRITSENSICIMYADPLCVSAQSAAYMRCMGMLLVTYSACIIYPGPSERHTSDSGDAWHVNLRRDLYHMHSNHKIPSTNVPSGLGFEGPVQLYPNFLPCD